MQIEIVAADVAGLGETGFGGVGSCYNFYNVVKRKYPETKFYVLNDYQDIQDLGRRHPDYVVCGVKYINSGKNKIWLSNYLEKHNIYHMGTAYKNLKYDSDKVAAKLAVAAAGIKTPAFRCVENSKDIEDLPVTFSKPLFVKPMTTACSYGVTKASLTHSRKELSSAIDMVCPRWSKYALIEEFLPGREFTVICIGNGQQVEFIPVELGWFSKNGYQYLSRAVKIANIENLRIVNDSSLSNLLINFASRVFKVLKVLDFARIDIRLDENNEPEFLEINMYPGFTKGRSYFPLACEKSGHYTYEECLLKVCETGLKRVGKII